MNKITKLLSVFVIAGAMGVSALGIAGCNKHTHTYGDYTDNHDGATHSAVCTDGDDTLTERHTDRDFNDICDICGGEVTHPVALDDDDTSATPVTAQQFADETGTPAQVAAPKVVAKVSDGAALEAGNVDAEFEFDPAKLSTTKYATGWTDGIFTLGNNTEVRGRIKTGLYEDATLIDGDYVSVNSVKLGSATDSLSIKVPAAGTLVFYVQNGSSGTTGTQTVVLTKPNGSTQTVSYRADGSGSTIQRVTLQLDAEGTYKISRTSGTSDIFYANFSATLPNSPVESIKVSNTGTVDYLVGQQLDCTGISVMRVHSTGVTVPVPADQLEIDASGYNPNVAGTYTVKVKYKVEGNLGSDVTEFETSYEVNVYEYSELSVYVDKITTGKTSAAGNTVYYNTAFRQFYFKGEAFSTEGISLIVTGTLDGQTKSFKLSGDDAQFSGYDMNTAGVQTVKVSCTLNGVTKSQGILITVKEKPADIRSEREVVLAVNKDFANVNVGTKNSMGAYRFNTVQQAMEFLNAAELDASVPKTLYLAEGDYWEKVEVTVPNLAIIGSGAETTKIEYDGLYGVEDAGGFVNNTDSTSTFNVRDTAVGFTIKGVTISNYYNSASSYTGAPSNDCRALAMLIMADKVVVEDCTLLGYQDTLELFTGRQIFKNCLIMGVTDYIFGSNNTTISISAK